MLKQCLILLVGFWPLIGFCKIQVEEILENFETVQLTSSVNNLSYELYIHLPSGYQEGKRSYPVAILQDVRVTLPPTIKAIKSLAGKEVKDVILVGMSYSRETTPKISRTRDFTPTYAPNEKHAHSLEAQYYSGKARNYMQFIDEDVLPLLKKNYRIDNENKIFIGHSFGGLLGAYMLLVNSDLFDSYILSSPSLWYDKRAILRLEESYSHKNTSMNARVLMYIGEEEANSKRGNMVLDVINYEKALKSRNYRGLNVSATVLNGENHSTAFSRLIPGALKELIPVN